MIEAILRALFSSLVGTLGFSLLVHSPISSILPGSCVGALTYLIYWGLMELGLTDAAAIFLASLLGSMLAQAFARRMHMIATIFILLSIVPLVPGLGLYRFMALLGSGQTAAGAQVGVNAMVSIAMIALGLGVGNFVYRLLLHRPKRRQVHRP